MDNVYEEIGLKRFEIRNGDLALLASEAGIDLRNHINKRRQEEVSIQYLAKLLDEATEGEYPLATRPDNSCVLMYSISSREEYSKYWERRPIEDIVLETKLMSDKLKNFKNLPKEKLEELTEFCIRLSIEVVRYQQEYCFDRYRLVA